MNLVSKLTKKVKDGLQNVLNGTAQAKSSAEPELDPGQQVANIVKPLIENNELHKYIPYWASQGFHVAADVLQIERQQFSTTALEGLQSRFLPGVFVVGAAKSATTTLYEYLRNIPDICMSNPKEPYFFEYEYALGIDHYREKYFKHWMGEPIIGEARHRNLYLPYIARRIYEFNPAAKIIIIVRNPVDRAYSHWWHWFSRGLDTLSFREAIMIDYDRIQKNQNMDAKTLQEIYYAACEITNGRGPFRTYLDSGYYYKQIQRYRQVFPDEQIKVVCFSDLRRDAYAFIKSIEAFLNIDYYTKDNFSVLRSNQANEKEMKQPPMDPEVRQWLVDHYRDHNAKLSQIIDRDLSDWDRVSD
ncbi:MAG: sulfotransferase [Anaerolineaceae bacterium]|nr:sulfotransferase [Anaerolineaceae bacterium]